MHRLKQTITSVLLALTLIATAPLTGLAGSDFALAKDTQQNRVIAHALKHQGKRFSQIEDRKDGIKISAGSAWCAWYIEHCSYKCGLGSVIPSKSSSDFLVGNLAQDLVKNKNAKITFVNKTVWNKLKGKFTKSRRSYNKNYQPRKGDIVLYANYQISGSYWFSHVGFVYDNCDKALTGVKTVEGNTMASNENKWEKTSIVGVRDNADDSNKERRIAAYITPNYCKHSKVDKTTGVCKNSKCKADYYCFDNVDTSCATDEEAGVTYTLIVDSENGEVVWLRSYPASTGKKLKSYAQSEQVNVVGTVKSGKWYKICYLTATGAHKYGYVAKDKILQDDRYNDLDN